MKNIIYIYIDDSYKYCNYVYDLVCIKKQHDGVHESYWDLISVYLYNVDEL
jgi:hypothetical protein